MPDAKEVFSSSGDEWMAPESEHDCDSNSGDVKAGNTSDTDANSVAGSEHSGSSTYNDMHSSCEHTIANKLGLDHKQADYSDHKVLSASMASDHKQQSGRGSTGSVEQSDGEEQKLDIETVTSNVDNKNDDRINATTANLFASSESDEDKDKVKKLNTVKDNDCKHTRALIPNNMKDSPEGTPAHMISYELHDASSSASSRMNSSIFSLCPEIMKHIFGFLDTADKQHIAQISYEQHDASSSALGRMNFSILSLCPEIMKHIFGFLDTADKQHIAQVCTTWCSVVYLPSLWHNIKVQLKDVQVDPVLYQSLNARGIGVVIHSTKILVETFWDNVQNLLCLELLKCVNLDERTIQSISSLTKLKTLRIMMCDVSIDQLVISLPLEHLTFQFCDKLTDDTLLLISLHLCQLRSIDLTGSGHVTNMGLMHLAKLDKLCSINLNGQKNISDGGMCYLASMPSLRDLSLNFCQIRDEGLAILANGGSGLVNLSLLWCIMVTNVGLGHLTQLTKLCQVDVTGCHFVTSVGLDCLMEKGVRIFNSELHSMCVRLGLKL